jgi:phage shock protein PspC (stress-responsive transcriptional regulator)
MAEPFLPPESSDRKRLQRSRDERVLFGVCGGLAEYFGLDPNVVRIGTVLVTLFPPTTAIGLIGYVALAILLPQEGTEHLPARERLQRNLTGLRTDVTGLTDTVRSGIRGGTSHATTTSDASAMPDEDDVDRAARYPGRNAA